jgi:pimeloyl-ACP methyl ester carboxylesterase
VINSFDDAPIVCGWSYGGMVITGLELPEGSHLVYLCAYMPDETESAYTLSLKYPNEIATIFHADDAGDMRLVGDGIDAYVWADAPADRAEVARASLRPQSMETLLATPERVSWQTLPTTYVICRQDRTINPDLQRELAQRANRVIEWDTSHSPMLSRPDLLIDLLDRVATGR